MTNIVLPEFNKKHVVVYGDVMLDRYYHGDALRISPEAPVPVVAISAVENRPGGAANVAQNIAALGAKVTLCGLVGEDRSAQELEDCLKTLPIDCQFLALPDFPTITKLRVIGRQQQLIRLDFEKNRTSQTDDDALFGQYCAAIKTADVVVLSDYSKGALDHVEALIAEAKKYDLPILIDPKHKNYERYAGATLLTPNLKEFESVVGACNDLDEVVKKALLLLEKIKIESLLITLGKDGMVFVKPGEKPVHFPTKAREVFDVTGAGDTVIAVLAAGLAAGLKTVEAVELSNLAAGVVVSRLGAQAVTLDDLHHAMLRSGDSHVGMLNEYQLLLLVKDAKKRGEKIVMTNGCFDILHPGHVDYLAKAKALGHRLVVAVNDDASVRRLKGVSRPVNNLQARMMMLANLKSVDWVIAFSEDTPVRIIEAVDPDVLVKANDYQIHEIAGSEFVLAQGGDVKTIPMLEGFSTSKLIEKMREKI